MTTTRPPPDPTHPNTTHPSITQPSAPHPPPNTAHVTTTRPPPDPTHPNTTHPSAPHPPPNATQPPPITAHPSTAHPTPNTAPASSATPSTATPRTPTPGTVTASALNPGGPVRRCGSAGRSVDPVDGGGGAGLVPSMAATPAISAVSGGGPVLAEFAALLEGATAPLDRFSRRLTPGRAKRSRARPILPKLGRWPPPRTRPPGGGRRPGCSRWRRCRTSPTTACSPAGRLAEASDRFPVVR